MSTALGPSRSSSHRNWRLTRNQRILRNSATFIGLFILTAIIARHPDLFNRPAAQAISDFVPANSLAGHLAYLITIPRAQSIILATLFCYSWFSIESDNRRGWLIAGLAASVFAAIVAQIVEVSLVTSPKPIFDQMIQFPAPSELGASLGGSYGMHTFPSPRAALYLGLAMTIFLVQPALGALALCITLFIEGARMLVGFHYPTDIAGSLLLAAASVSASRLSPMVALCGRVLKWESVHSAAFYTCFFIFLLELSVSFEDVRQILTLFRSIL